MGEDVRAGAIGDHCFTGGGSIELLGAELVGDRAT